MTGNVIFKRYLQNTRWAKNATKSEDMKRFTELTVLFKKYATQYDFDWLLLMAQGYQESGLDQRTRSPVGAIGIMQVMPTTAKDRNVAIKDIHLPEPNIHAGVKYMRFLVNEYFDEPAIDRVNRHLFAFAAYNAGPNRISRLRGETAKRGLDPDKWVQQRRAGGGRASRPRAGAVRQQHLQVLHRVPAHARTRQAARGRQGAQVRHLYLTT
jgi:membrane-bound lytic murein transglycosylase MltF